MNYLLEQRQVSAVQIITGTCGVMALWLPALCCAEALEAYVRAQDQTYTWGKLKEREQEGMTVLRLNLASQTWRGNRWTHELLVVRPPEVRNPDVAFLHITGDEDVQTQFSLLKALASSAGAIAVAVNRVPNQPLYGGLREDALIAYTFDQYVRTGDKTWPLLFPMVKSATQAMNAVQEVVQEHFNEKVERFVVGGASKRGWTTWLTAAVDERVAAITPMVIDMLNMKAQTDWAKTMYGRQSEQIQDYTALQLVERMDEPRMKELRSWVDPYSHRQRYHMPKLLLLGTNDRYWVVDSLRHYWDELPGPKFVYQTPNAGHDLGGGRQAIPTLTAFFQTIADRHPLPEVKWDFAESEGGARISVRASPVPKASRLWVATSRNRDFRDAFWNSREVEGDGNSLQTRVTTPEHGFCAYMMELEFESPTGHRYKLSTEARVTPDGAPRRKPAS